jgi:hypothetical protein
VTTVPERFPGATIAAVAVIFFTAYAGSLIWFPKPNGRILIGDALQHYVQLRSIVFDRDLQFRNEYVHLYGLKGGEPDTEWIYDVTPTGYVRNRMPVGPALLWSPLFLLVSLGVWIAHLAGSGYPLDGYGRLFQASAGLTGVVAAGVGSWMAYRAARTLFATRPAIWATLTIWLSSSAVYYSLISPAYSHAPSMLAVGAFWLVWLRRLEGRTLWGYAGLGALCGVAALMRWQDAVLLIVPALDVAWHLPASGLRRAIARLAACGAAAAAAFAPQMVVWARLYGAPLAIPQGDAFMRWHDPALISMLISDRHGLLSWTPVIAFAIAGFVPLVRRFPLVGTAAIVYFLISFYVNAAAADWWAGEAFGARRFVSCFPVFVIGLAALFDHFQASRQTGATVLAVFASLTFLLLVQYQTFMHGRPDLAPYPAGLYGLWLARFHVPLDLARAWLGAP